MGRKTEGQAEHMFKIFGQKLDRFIAELKETKEHAGDEFETRFEELKRNFASLEDQLKDFKENNKDKWEKVQDELNQAGKSVKQAFDSAFAKKS
jgi:chaperonin cofactor prefoldin